MNKMKKLLSVVLAVVLAFSAFSVLGSAAKTAYKTVAELEALDAYSDYGQVTRLSLEERTSIVLDALDNLLGKANINLGKILNVNLVITKLELTIDLTSIDKACDTIDQAQSLLNNGLVSVAKAIVNLGILEDLDLDSWQSGMSRDGTAQFTIISEILEVLKTNTGLVNNVLTNGIDLGMISLGDMSSIEDIVLNLPGFIKGMVYPMIERWDDTLTLIKDYDNSIAGTGKNVEAIANMRVQKLFSDNMSNTTIKYDVNGNMTSEHTDWLAKATGSAAPGTPSANSTRCYYQFTSTTPGSVMTVYHIVDAAEAKALAKTPDKVNGSPAAYTYFKEAQTFVMSQEVEGSSTYVWKATDDFGNTWSLKYYNDDSQFLPGITGDDIDLSEMSLADLLYKFFPVVFEQMAPVVLNGSVKKILAEFLGVDFTYVGQVGDDAVNALPDAGNTFFTEEQGEYLWEWSNYAVINGNHYYRFEDQIFAGDLSHKNNYFDIINWDYNIDGDFMDAFIPTEPSANSTLLMNFNNFLVKVAEEALLPSAETYDMISEFEATWTRPALTKGDNSNLVANLKAVAQAVIGLAPQHVFGDNYATNERCYVELMLSSDNDTVLTGIAAHLVNMIMPSMSLPGKSKLVESGAKVGAILAAVVREFAAYLAPEYNFDALIYADFGTTEADSDKTFVSGKDSGYWFDVILTMGINVGFEYLRAFADMGEGTEEWNAFVAATGYKVDGGVYSEADLKLTEEVNQWESMVDYILDWALTTNVEWCWKMGNLVDVNGEVNLKTVQDPWKKLDSVLDSLLPVNEILNVTATDCETELEQLLRYNFILAIVDLRWDDLLDTLKVPNGFVRNANVLDQLAGKLKGIVNYLFKKVGNEAHNFELIPSVITDFDSLANQGNLKTMVVNLVGALYTAGVTNKGCDTLFPFLNFLLGWKTDPQDIADPVVWTVFRDGDDYAFQWNESANRTLNVGEAINTTTIKVLNNSAGMLEKHRGSDVTDHAYDIQIKSVTADGAKNKLSFTYGDGNGLVSPYETLDIAVGGTYQGEEAVTVTIAYDYVGKDGSAIGGTQYTSLSFLISHQYEDANVGGRFSGDDNKEYVGIDQYPRYNFTENLYESVTEFRANLFYVSATIGSNPDKNFETIAAPDWDQECGKDKVYYPMSDLAATYFDYITDRAESGLAPTLSKEGTTSTSGKLYKAKSNATPETEFPYGAYHMGRIAVAYEGDNKHYLMDFIHYNDYDIYDIFTENKDNGYNANQGVDSATYNEYNAAWKDIVKYATYPMMTTASGADASVDYVASIQPKIPAAIERFETAKKDYETALAEAQASGSATAELPAYVQALKKAIDEDFINEKEINFQDYEFYEYFNYNDVKVEGENVYRSYLAPEVMDQYYIMGSGIRQAELGHVIDAEANPFIKAGITASRMENDAEAISASQAAHDEWVAPVYTKLHVDDLTSRISYYKQFLAANAEGTEHMYFLNQEIAHVEAQGLVESDYTEDSWANYEAKLAEAKKVAAGEDKFSSFNSRIYDVKYNLMVAYKNLLLKDDSLKVAGGTGDLEANIDIANEIFASLEAGDGAWALKEGVDADKAYAQLISALGYNYQARYSINDAEVKEGEKNPGDLKYNNDGTPMMFNLYADSALEYAENDRPDNQNNRAKVNAANAALVAAIENFEAAAQAEPELILTDLGAEIGAVISTTYGPADGFTGAVFGVDTLGTGYDGVTATLEEAYTTEAGYIVINTEATGGVETTGTVIELYNDDDVLVASYVFIYFGDVNRDGSVDTVDASFIEEYYAWIIDIPEEFGLVSGDVNGDMSLDTVDASFIEEYYAWIVDFPLQAELAAIYNA